MSVCVQVLACVGHMHRYWCTVEVVRGVSRDGPPVGAAGPIGDELRHGCKAARLQNTAGVGGRG